MSCDCDDDKCQDVHEHDVLAVGHLNLPKLSLVLLSEIFKGVIRNGE